MSKNFLYSFIVIFSFISLSTGCAPQVPNREEMRQILPSIPNNYGRLYFFNGTYFSTWEMDNNKYGSAGNILINNKQSGIINRQEYIVIDLPAERFELSWVPIMADIDMKKRKSKPLELNIHPGMTYFIAANTRDAGSNIGLWFGAAGYLASDLLFIDTLEEIKELSKTSTRLVDYQVIKSNASEKAETTTNAQTKNEETVSKDTNNQKNDVEIKLSKLKKLYKEGLINQEEYDLKRKQLLEEF